MQTEALPLISILLPMFDAEATLEPCLRSIRRQTVSDWECVIVDDGSTDPSAGIVERFAASDPRMRLLRRPHRGLVAALNAGLGACRGRYIARMDADDLMHRQRLADQLRLLQARPELAAVGCHVRLFPRESAGPGYRAYENWINGLVTPEQVLRDAFVECPLAHPTLFAHRGPIVRLGYRDRGWAEDYDLLLRMLGEGLQLGVLPSRRLVWRLGSARLSRTSEIYSDVRFTACKAAFLAESFLAGHARYTLWGHGGTGRRLSRELARLGKHPAQIIELHPGRLGQRIRGATVYPPAALSHLERLPLVASVAGAQARRLIREQLARFGYRETRDFVCAA